MLIGFTKSPATWNYTGWIIPGENTGLLSWEPLVTFSSTVNTLIVLGVFLFCWFTNTELMVNSTVTTCLTEVYLTCIFSMRHIMTFLCLGILDSTSTLTIFGSHLKQWTHQENKNTKSVALNRARDTCLQYEVKQESNLLPCSNLTGNMQGKSDLSLCTAWKC